MKTKIVFYLTLVVALAMFTTGCCTSALIDRANDGHVEDTFNPSAIYQQTNHNNFALEGTRFINSNQYLTPSDAPSNHGYLMISQKALVSAHLLTNLDLSIIDIKKLPIELTEHLPIKKKLPQDYQKNADLPTNSVTLIVKEGYTQKGQLIFLPFAVAIDVATSPIQAVFWYLVFSSMGHNC